MANLELSPREREVAKCIAQGLKPTDIARHLGLSVKTVSTYRGRIMEKTGMSSNVAIAAYCIEKGVSPPLNTPDYRGVLEYAYKIVKEVHIAAGMTEGAHLIADRLAGLRLKIKDVLYPESENETAVSSDG